MAEMGEGYGSECHLLRYLGRHRCALDQRLLDAIGGQAVEWLDYRFDSKRTWQDAEWKGLDFLDADSPARAAWKKAWPQQGNPPNWDAVGNVTVNGAKEWLLVEAKAHRGELRSSCEAGKLVGKRRTTGKKESASRKLIADTLADTKLRLGVAADRDWLEGYYQYANRIAVLDLLVRSRVPARLLNIYFTGDVRGEGRSCPSDARGWDKALASLKAHIGLPSGHALQGRVHELFLPVCPPA